MWTRKELKTKAKEAIKKAYWKCVLVGLIFAFLVGQSGGSGAGGVSSGISNALYSNSTEVGEEVEVDDNDEDTEEIDNTDSSNTSETIEYEDGLSITSNEDGSITVDTQNMSDDDFVAVGVAVFVVVLIVCLIAIAFGVLFDALIINPLELGVNRYFYKNLDEPASLSNVVYGFEHNYKNIAKGMFMRDLYIVLWSLLFVIPGIVKSYSYRLVPYILADDSEMSYNEALQMSEKLMKGNKWRAFVLDLSFIGWNLLSSLTCGLLAIFYVTPYKLSTNAALYEAIRYGAAE